MWCVSVCAICVGTYTCTYTDNNTVILKRHKKHGIVGVSLSMHMHRLVTWGGELLVESCGEVGKAPVVAKIAKEVGWDVVKRKRGIGL